MRYKGWQSQLSVCKGNMNGADDKDDDDDDDDDVWAHVIRDVKPLRRDRRETRSTPPPVKKTAQKRRDTLPLPVPPRAGADQPPGIDRRTDEKLRRGQMEIDGRIDLHGMGQAEAYEALRGFLLAGYGKGRRCVLVITGKGRGGRGVLREKTPEWLREGELANIVLRFYPAKPQHGGDGALYVLLRRRRD